MTEPVKQKVTTEKIDDILNHFRNADTITDESIRTVLGGARTVGIKGSEDSETIPIIMGDGNHLDFEEEGIVFYFGEGDKQYGDQRLTRGNKRLRNTIDSGQPIVLFRKNNNTIKIDDCYRLLGEPLRILYDEENRTLLVFPMIHLSLYDRMKRGDIEDTYRKAESILRKRFPDAQDDADPDESGWLFRNYLESEGIIISKELVENLLLSIKVKPFVIMSGGSGNGKTRIAQLLGKSLNQGDDDKKRYTIVPVGSNWTDGLNIVGYWNPINNEYHHTDALDLIIRANRDPKHNYALILDEMNLSRVEYYFSDFLSAMESGERISLHEGEEPESVVFGNNLIVIGTVNVDETTYTFSPKVLDRANVLMFPAANVETALGSEQKPAIENINWEYLLNHDDDERIRSMDSRTISSEFNDNGLTVMMNEVKKTLSNIQNALKKMGIPMGYRTIDEMMRFMYAAWNYKGRGEFNNWKRYFNAQVMQKVLPKVHGDMSIREGLIALRNCFDKTQSTDISVYSKLDDMVNTLEKNRYVSFNS